MMFKLCLFAALALAMSGPASAANNRVVCYLGSWANYRPGNGAFKIEDIDPRLCTHLIYAFVGIGTDGSVRILDAWLDLELGAMKRLNDLRQINPNLKTLVAIGGWNEGSEKFSTVAGDPNVRATFVKNVVEFVTVHEFDGFDLDWEYPAQRGGKPEDKHNFGILTGELRAAFDKHSPPLLLTAAVSAAEKGIEISYDVPTMNKNLDFINIMAYDLHGSWEKVLGHNAPLYAHHTDVTADQLQLNVDACVHAWINAGASPERLVLGMGTYGRSFTMGSSDTNIGAPAAGAGQQGPFTQEAGMLGYNEICADKSWIVEWDDEQKVPYAHKDNQWVGYDNVESITIKTEYAKAMGLGGVMIWSIETEDFKGACGPQYPLLHAMNDALGKPVQSTTSKPTSPQTQGPTSGPAPSDGLCKVAGYVRDPDDCAKFYYCMEDGQGGFIKAEYQCAPGLYFDVNTKACNYADQVEC